MDRPDGTLLGTTASSPPSEDLARGDGPNLRCLDSGRSSGCRLSCVPANGPHAGGASEETAQEQDL